MVLVLGLGKSGKEVALLLKQKGEDVTVVESQKNFSTILRKEELEKYNIKVIFHPYEDSILQDAKLVVVSPGLPLSLPVIEKAKNLNIPVIGEIDVACRFIEKENIIGITGTNGKTTTTFLTYKLLKKAGKKVKIGGNIGVPLCRVARKLSLEENYKIVTEVSSFQLEAGTEFSPGIYCILNIAPNHLDRHSSFSEYLQIKASPLSRMKKEDIVFLNYDQPELKELEKKTCAKVIFFSKREKIKEGIFLREGKIFANIEGKKFKISLTPQLLKKFHNPENVLCATGICLVEGVLPEVIEDFLSFYTPLPHRQEIVGEIRGVKFIDDSKA
ncbi:UDP-N-acetylmuramoyl-L-alanine--D-glutamate ligase, partial [Candidatus Aerophobetes bacterium]|nr:UDP-N-acetylmuramoyl-L-alanine--D-glutamate ligase [Candidatus Aerophobetes bacterium]